MYGFNERFFLLLGEPERLFKNLKKRFSNRKNALKRLKRSGAGRNDGVQKVEEELRKYAFLEWINPYVAARDPKVIWMLHLAGKMSLSTIVIKSSRRKKMMKVAGKRILKETI